ncbi:MAG: DUF4352 domain-containing protein [Rhodococcus sp. (in: high G+C Gram-positive bacteria)]|uniref:DUF4352 domain-containing protein n=1 Tax=Rhodococcus sp. TaxID=1831 RepID=UPI003BB0BB7A
MTDPVQPYQNPSQPTPAPKKRRIWPWIVVGVPILLFGACSIAVVSSVGGDEDTAVTTNSGEEDATPDSGPAFPGKLGEDTAANGGDTITRDGLAYTVSALEPASTIIGDYLCSTVTIKNVGDKQNDFNGYTDWSLQDTNGAIRDATFAPDREPLNSGKVAPGGQATGSVCFDSRQGTPSGTYVVLFEDTFSLSTDRLAWVNNR